MSKPTYHSALQIKQRRASDRTPEVDEHGLTKWDFLGLERLPAVLSDQQVAWLLNLHSDDIPCLIGAGLLCALGSPGPRDRKRFSRTQILQLLESDQWLEDVTRALQVRNKEKVQRQSSSQ